MIKNLIKKLCCLLVICLMCYSSEYISLKKLCYYDDVAVPQKTQKKIYGILAPLFSQKLSTERYPEEKISYDNKKLQAVIYVLKGFFPSEILVKMFGLHLFHIRQNKIFDSRVLGIPFSYNDKIWLLHKEKRLIEQHGKCKSSNRLQLSNYTFWNFNTYPQSVLKCDENGLFICLFRFGCISVVNLKTMQEIWSRGYSPNRIPGKGVEIVVNDDYGDALTGYRSIIAFFKQNEKKFNFYDFADPFNPKKQLYEIYSEDFKIAHTENCKLMIAMNVKYFFYTFYNKRWIERGPHSHYHYSSIKDFSNNLYFFYYKLKKKQKVFYTLKDDNGVFFNLECNDTRLIAQDDKAFLYVWDLTQEPCILCQIINSNSVSPFWLDTDSEKIFNYSGIFTIQNIFDDLPKVGFKTARVVIEEHQEHLNQSNSFLKKLLLSICWFIQCLYQKIKAKMLILYQ